MGVANHGVHQSEYISIHFSVKSVVLGLIKMIYSYFSRMKMIKCILILHKLLLYVLLYTNEGDRS